jgi:hypothetical protein
VLSLNAPLMIGPLPLIVTLVSAVIYGNAIASGTDEDGLHSLAAFFAALGAVTLATFLLWPDGNYRLKLVACQPAIVIMFHLLLIVIKRGIGNSNPPKALSVKKLLTAGAICLALYIVSNIFVFLPLAPNPCGAQKCSAVQSLYVAKYGEFGLLWWGCSAGSLFLSGFTMAIANLRRFKRYQRKAQG